MEVKLIYTHFTWMEVKHKLHAHSAWMEVKHKLHAHSTWMEVKHKLRAHSLFQLNIREEEVQRLNAKNKELQQEIRTHLQEMDDRDNKVSWFFDSSVRSVAYI